MNFKQKLVYMALGCLFTLIGYTLATLNTDVTAQSESTVVDEIVCRRLVITDTEGTNQMVLGDIKPDTEQEGNLTGMAIIGKDGDRTVFLGVTESGGAFVEIRKDTQSVVLSIDQITGPALRLGKDSNSGATLSSIYAGAMHIQGPKGSVDISDLGVVAVGALETGNKSSAMLTTFPHGGAVMVTDKNGQVVSSMGVSEKGGGLIKLRDQHNKSAIELFFNDEGGGLAIFNKSKENVLQASVGYKGGGVISTKDKNGYRTGRLP